MKAHLEFELLWEYKTSPLTAEEAAHLRECEHCTQALTRIQQAQDAVSALSSAPRLPDALSRRVGQALARAADAEAAKRFAPWWTGWLSSRKAWAIAAAALALMAYFRLQPHPEATPSPSAPATIQATAVVASAQKATVGKEQRLAAGTRVSTQRGGQLWLQLPDGSRAGLTGATDVTLSEMNAQRLTLEVHRGDLALVVPHREDRVLTVRAGDLSVVDLGTRFVVSQTAQRTFVAVEEGRVEVITPVGRRELAAHRALTWRDGTLAESAWNTPPPSKAAESSLKSQTDVVSNQEASDTDGELTPSSADEWASLPETPPAVLDAPSPPPTTVELERSFSLLQVERKLRELGAEVGTSDRRQALVRALTAAADAGDCKHALWMAERWLRETPTTSPDESDWRRTVLRQKLRCFNHLGRSEDASAVERELERLPLP